MKNLVNEINHLLVDRKMDKSELAAILGMSRQNMSRILSDKKVKADLSAGTLERIARALKVNIGHFFDDDVNSLPYETGRLPIKITNGQGGTVAMEQILREKLVHLKELVAVEDQLLHQLNEEAKGK